MVKPDTTTAMHQLINQIKTDIPFDIREAYVCTDNCKGCSMKLLEFLDMEIYDWEQRLQSGEKPDFGELHRLASMGKKIYRVLENNGLIKCSTKD